jgi:uncharacterized protein with ParB-like and HNH nuclease domain/alkylated DNA nucleotide flippase Atl1
MQNLVLLPMRAGGIMRASETVLRTLLQGEKQYVVPHYQRTYSWKRQQLEQLWSDIESLLLSEAQDDGHFLGSLVLAPSQSNTASGIQSWLVVDGQQRLTTLSILLCAIRDYSYSENNQLARKINVQYLTNEFAEGLEAYSLLPTQADRNAWIALVDGNPLAGGEDSIGNAYRFFRGRLEQASQEYGYINDVVQRIEQVVVSRLSFVEISAHVGDNVYRIFESLNNTGLKLTQADLLRNYLFMRLPTSAERVYRQHWLPMQQLLSDQDLVDLIWLDLILMGNRGATQHSLYREQHRLLGRLASEKDVEDWIVELYRKARIFRRVLRPVEEKESSIREALDRLHRWRATVVYPIALRILLSYEDGEMDAMAVAESLRVVESYLVRQLIVGVGRAGNNVMLNDLVKSLQDEVPTSKAITRVLTRQRGRFPTDQAVRSAMLEQPFYWRGKEWQKTFVLRCLEEGHGRAEKIDFGGSRLSIEHILPQTITDDWEALLQGDLGEYDSVQELHQSIVHTIGNLTLSAYNGKLSNKTFHEKKKILAQSGLAMNLEVASHDSWGLAEIRARSERLAEVAVAIWPGPDGSADVEPQSPRLALVRQALSEIPTGRWTNYLTIAQVAGSHRRTISKWIADSPLPNAHRILKSDGSVPAMVLPGFRNAQEQIARLESEGIEFGTNGRASMSQHIGFDELIRMVEDDLEE